jgi:hypothetical protein
MKLSKRKVVQPLLDNHNMLVRFGVGKKLNVPSYVFPLDPYSASVFVYIGDDWRDVYARLLEQTGINKFFALTLPDFPFDNCYTLFFPESDVEPNTIAHESLHVVSRVLIKAGIKLDTTDANDEPYAYLLGKLVETLTLIITYHKRTNRSTQPRKGIK